MYLKKLKLQNFRNHKDTELVFSDGLNFFIGNNGEGKTNLLEAIHSISTFKSFRGNSNRELTLWDDSFFYIKAEFESLGEDKRIEFAFQKLDKDKIKMKLNGEAVTKKVDLVGEFKSIIYSPVDMEIIEGGPKKRRKFLDTLIAGFDRRYYKNLLEYNGILKRRNTLLKKRQVLKAELFPWNKLLVERGTLIQEIRSKYALQLNEYFKTNLMKISGEKDCFNFTYKPNVSDLSSYEQKMELSLSKDIHLGYTSSGIHRDLIFMGKEERDLIEFASQGQKRSVVIALKTAAFQLMKELSSQYPVLLIDDVIRELDIKRRQYFLDLLSCCGQVFFTTTDLDGMGEYFENFGRPYKVFKVTGGGVFETDEKG